MAAIPNAVVPAGPSGTVTRWFDLAPDATNRFYRIQVLPLQVLNRDVLPVWLRVDDGPPEASL
jgi:hypothetical protein